MPDLHSLYEKRYSGEMRFQTSRRGTHSVVMEVVEPFLDGARVLDVGCGAGRLTLMAATSAREVKGVDYSERAIALAKLCAAACNLEEKVSFHVQNADEGFEGTFEVVLLSEVIEHVPNPILTLQNLHAHLTAGGILVASCPSFINFRGYMWMLLQETFELLMSPSDVRQVYPHDIEQWAETAGFTVQQMLGLHYEWAWTEDAVVDMTRRIQLAIRDKRTTTDAWEAVRTDFDAMDRYLKGQVAYHEEMVAYLAGQGILKKPREWGLTVVVPDVARGDEELLDEMKKYLRDGRIWYTDQRPFSLMGAGLVCVMRKTT